MISGTMIMMSRLTKKSQQPGQQRRDQINRDVAAGEEDPGGFLDGILNLGQVPEVKDGG